MLIRIHDMEFIDRHTCSVGVLTVQSINQECFGAIENSDLITLASVNSDFDKLLYHRVTIRTVQLSTSYIILYVSENAYCTVSLRKPV